MKVDPDAGILFIYGSSTANASGVGIVFRIPEGAVIRQAVRLGFKAFDNKAKYE